MKSNQSETDPPVSGPRINRRQVLGLGAATIGGLAVSTFGPSVPAALALPNAALGADAANNAASTSGVAGPLSVTAAVAGRRYRNIGIFEFFDNNTGGRSIGGGVYPAASSFLVSGVDLPAGATVTEYSVWATNTAASSFTVTLNSFGLDSGSGSAHTSVTIPAGTTSPTEFKTLPNFVISTARAYDVESLMPNDGTKKIHGVRIGYTTDDGINLVPGARVLANQTLANGASVVVDCSGSAPAGATAVLVTILAFATTSDGYLSCYADGAPNPLTLNCYWAAGAQTATAAIVPISTARRMKMTLTTGGGSVGVAVDIAGYLI